MTCCVFSIPSFPKAVCCALQAGFFDEYGNYQLRSVAVDYKDAWLESLPADMGNVNVSEGGDPSASSGAPQLPNEHDDEAREAEELSRLRRRIVDLLLPSGESFAEHLPRTNRQRREVHRFFARQHAENPWDAMQRLSLPRCGG